MYRYPQSAVFFLCIIAVLNYGAVLNVLALSLNRSMMHTSPLNRFAIGKILRQNAVDRSGSSSTNKCYSSRGGNIGMPSSSQTAQVQNSRLSRVRSSTTSKSATSDALSVSATPSQSLRFTFKQRMMDVMFNRGGSKMKSIVFAATKTLSRRGTRQQESSIYLQPNVHLIENVNDYKKIVADEETKLVVVRFFAPWCRACKAVAPIFHRMAKQSPGTVFVDFLITEENSKGLGVECVPFCHIYHPTAGLVEELRFIKPKTRNAIKIFQTYLQGECKDIEINLRTGLYSSPFERQNLR